MEYREVSETLPKVEFRPEDGGFSMYLNGESFYIKGAVGRDFLDELAASGANSLRTGPRLLDEAHRLEFRVLVNLPVRAERDGFDYDDPEAVKAQYERVKNIVEENRDHPALLMWAIGNELDHIPGSICSIAAYGRRLSR